jgi:hypothetical protein
MSLFHHNLAFAPIDPTADGLADDIAAERNDPEAIQLTDTLDPELPNIWDAILEDAHKDPEFVFSNDDEDALY